MSVVDTPLGQRPFCVQIADLLANPHQGELKWAPYHIARLSSSSNASGTARDGKPYSNIYAWFLEMRAGKVVKASAFFDSIEFNQLGQRVNLVAKGLRGSLPIFPKITRQSSQDDW